MNLRAPWLATKFAAPMLGPSILNAASASSFVGVPLGPVYCTTKGGLLQLTRVTAVDLAPVVRCNCFCPGTIETPLSRAFIGTGDDPDEQERQMLAPQLVDRLGTPEEVAKLACFLVGRRRVHQWGGVCHRRRKLAWRGRREHLNSDQLRNGDPAT